MNQRIIAELREAQKDFILETITHIYKDGYHMTVCFAPDHPFTPPKVNISGHNTVVVNGWSPVSTIVRIWEDFMFQVGKTEEERMFLASNSFSGFAFIPLVSNDSRQ